MKFVVKFDVQVPDSKGRWEQLQDDVRRTLSMVAYDFQDSKRPVAGQCKARDGKTVIGEWCLQP